MKAGRELDALIAQKVMGWPCAIDAHGYNTLFSTSIGHAWLVVEKLRHQPFTMEMYLREAECLVAFLDWNGTRRGAATTSAQAPELAICLAALNAVGCEGIGVDQAYDRAGEGEK